jgi:hypothetical protein
MYYILISSFLKIKKIKISVFYFFICIIYINFKDGQRNFVTERAGKAWINFGQD